MKLASNQTRKFENLEMREDPLALSIIKIRGKCSTGAVSAFAPTEIWQRVQSTRPETIENPVSLNWNSNF